MKKIICEAEGNERAMLELVYGAIGILPFNEKTQYQEQEGKI